MDIVASTEGDLLAMTWPGMSETLINDLGIWVGFSSNALFLPEPPTSDGPSTPLPTGPSTALMNELMNISVLLHQHALPSVDPVSPPPAPRRLPIND